MRLDQVGRRQAMGSVGQVDDERVRCRERAPDQEGALQMQTSNLNGLAKPCGQACSVERTGRFPVASPYMPGVQVWVISPRWLAPAEPRTRASPPEIALRVRSRRLGKLQATQAVSRRCISAIFRSTV